MHSVLQRKSQEIEFKTLAIVSDTVMYRSVGLNEAILVHALEPAVSANICATHRQIFLF